MNIDALLKLEIRLINEAKDLAKVAQEHTNAGRLEAATMGIAASLTLVDIQVALSKILDGIEEGVELEKN